VLRKVYQMYLMHNQSVHPSLIMSIICFVFNVFRAYIVCIMCPVISRSLIYDQTTFSRFFLSFAASAKRYVFFT